MNALVSLVSDFAIVSKWVWVPSTPGQSSVMLPPSG